MTERERIAKLEIDAATCRTHWGHQHKADVERSIWESKMDKRVRCTENRGAKVNGAAIVIGIVAGTLFSTIGAIVAQALMR